MSIFVFWIQKDTTPAAPDAHWFTDGDFMKAMGFMESLRKDGHSHVCMSTELAGNAGKPGVDAVVDGKTPDGETYDWSKQGRAGKLTRAEKAANAVLKAMNEDPKP